MKVSENEKFIETTDVWILLSRFSIPMNYQDVFISEVTKNDKIHIEDFIAKIWSNLKEFETNEALNSKSIENLFDLESTQFYWQCQSFIERNQNSFDRLGLVKDLQMFDKSKTGKIKIHHLINILKFKLKIFSEDLLKKLQFELECLNNDGLVDYEEFVSIAFKSKNENLISSNSAQII